MLTQRKHTPSENGRPPESVAVLVTPRHDSNGGTPPPPEAQYAPPAQPKPLLPTPAYAFGYLCTGTALAVLGQYVTNQGAFDPSTQLVAWTKYACTFLLSLTLQLVSGGGRRGGSKVVLDMASQRKAAWLTAAVGLLDTVSYGLNCLGFARCGSALSMVVFAACGQVFTAVTRRLLLGRSMTRGQLMGVALVVAGLVIRSLNKLMEAINGGGGGSGSSDSAGMSPAGGARGAMAGGVALIMLSALGYSLLGVLYEWLSAVRGPTMSHAQVATVTALIGLAATTAFQLVYTRPRWEQLVVARMEARGLDWGPVMQLYGVFGALFTVHGLVQGVVLQRAGATAVGIVSAMRASAVTLASGALFCSPAAPHQCLTPLTGGSAAVVTAGALVWTLTGPSKAKALPRVQAPQAGQPEDWQQQLGRNGGQDHDKTS